MPIFVIHPAGLLRISDFLFAAPSDLARTARLHINDINFILDKIILSHAPKPRQLSDVFQESFQRITTGDDVIDKALGGGIRTGLIYELVGES